MQSSKALRTTVVGSYPQPEWLIDRERLKAGTVPRVRRSDLWRVQDRYLDQAIKDATILAVRAMEASGVDVVTDGEIGRVSYSNHFAGALEGLDVDNPAVIVSRRGRETIVPRVVGPLRRTGEVEVDSARFLRGVTDRLTKVTLPGPFTLAQQVQDEHYGDLEALAMDFAIAINAEAKALDAVGIDVIQIDEPWVRNNPDAARAFGVKVIDKALEGLNAWTAIHLCFGYGFLVPGKKPRSYEFLSELADSKVDEIVLEAAQPKLDLGVLADLSNKTIALGVLDLSTPVIDDVDAIVHQLRAALAFISPERLMAAPDCGMKYLSPEIAFGKLRAMNKAAETVRVSL